MIKRYALYIILIWTFHGCSPKYYAYLENDAATCTLDGNTFNVLLKEKGIADTSCLFSEREIAEFQRPLYNHRVVLSFSGGTLASSWISGKKFESCLQCNTTCDGKIIAFTTSCHSQNEEVNAIWSGIVKGNFIQGTFTWLLPYDKTTSYRFAGKLVKYQPTQLLVQ